jgi:hydrogenase maturation protease
VKILVAGAGNVFLGDDAFGVEVVQQLSRSELPASVRLMDVGIRGVHLAYELLDGYDALILIDAMAHGEAPGTVTVFEREWQHDIAEPAANGAGNAHALDPEAVFALLASLGGCVERIYTIGCEPDRIDERMGLSASVAAAVAPAARAAIDLVNRIQGVPR